MSFQKFAAAALLAASAFAAAPASATQIFNFSFTTVTPGFGGPAADVGVGQFTTGDVGSPYAILSISGTLDGQAITGLSGFASADNLLYVPGTIADGYGSSPFFADVGGISFTSGGIDYNLSDWEGNTLNSIAFDLSGTGTAPKLLASFSITAVPEPASWALFLFGFGGIGWTLRARRQAQAATA